MGQSSKHKEENNCRDSTGGCRNREPLCHKLQKAFDVTLRGCIVLAWITFKTRIKAHDEASANPLFFEILIWSSLNNI